MANPERHVAPAAPGPIQTHELRLNWPLLDLEEDREPWLRSSLVRLRQQRIDGVTRGQAGSAPELGTGGS